MKVPARANSREPEGRDAASFYRALLQFARSRHVAFVIEGADPPRPVASPSGSSDDIARLAARYDYVVAKRGNVVVLRRRFDVPDGLPEVTFAELREFGQDAAKALKAFVQPPSPSEIEADRRVGGRDLTPDSTFVRMVHAALSPEQFLAFQGDSGQTLRVRDLPAPQKALVRRFAVYKDLGETANAADGFLWLLDVCRGGVITRKGRMGMVEKGLRVLGTFDLPNRYRLIPETDAEAMPNAAPPTEGDAVRPDGVLTLSLSVALDRWNRRAHGSGVSYGVRPSLAAKRVTLVAPENAATADLFHACAVAFRLRVRREDGGRIILDRFPMPPPRSEAEAVDCVFQGMPDPLRRAICGEELGSLLASQKAAASPAEREMARVRFVGRRNAYQWIVPASARRLRKSLAAPLAASANGTIPFAQLSSEDQAALALAFLDNLLERLATRPRLAPYVERFEEVYLSGGRSEGRLSLSLGLIGNDGTKDTPLFSVWNVHYHPEGTTAYEPSQPGKP